MLRKITLQKLFGLVLFLLIILCSFLICLLGDLFYKAGMSVQNTSGLSGFLGIIAGFLILTLSNKVYKK